MKTFIKKKKTIIIKNDIDIKNFVSMCDVSDSMLRCIRHDIILSLDSDTTIKVIKNRYSNEL